MSALPRLSGMSPRSAMPEGLQPRLFLNPRTIPTEQLPMVGFEGPWPDRSVLAEYSLVAAANYLFEPWAFASLNKGSADVV